MDNVTLTTTGPSGTSRRTVEKEQLQSELQSWFATASDDAFFVEPA